MLPFALEYSRGDRNGFRVYRPARGGRLCERFDEYRTIKQIPLPLPLCTSNVVMTNIAHTMSYGGHYYVGCVLQCFVVVITMLNVYCSVLWWSLLC